jgi:hypothetical protein
LINESWILNIRSGAAFLKNELNGYGDFGQLIKPGDSIQKRLVMKQERVFAYRADPPYDPLEERTTQGAR